MKTVVQDEWSLTTEAAIERFYSTWYHEDSAATVFTATPGDVR